MNDNAQTQLDFADGDDPRPAPRGPRSRLRRWHTERRSRQSRGAALVETALVITILLTLLFGIAEFGMVLRTKHGLAEATRAGARAAAALPRDSQFDEASANAVRAAILEAVPEESVDNLVIYRANPNTGLPLSGSLTTCSQCFRYTWDESASDWVVNGTSTWEADSQWACGLINQTDYVGVHIDGKHDFVTAFFADEITVSSRTIMRLEPVTGTSVCSPTTNPPPTAGPIATPTPGPTPTPLPTATALPTATPWPTGVPSPTPTPLPTATPVPSATPTPLPTATPTAGPTPTATATVMPSPTPTEDPWDPDFYYTENWTGYWPHWYVWWGGQFDDPNPLPSSLPPGCSAYGWWHGGYGTYHNGGWEVNCRWAQ